MYLTLTCTVRYRAQGKRTAGGVRQSHMQPTDLSQCEECFWSSWISFPLRLRLCWLQATVLEVMETCSYTVCFLFHTLARHSLPDTLLSLSLTNITPFFQKHVEGTCRWLYSCSSKPQMSLCWHCPKLKETLPDLKISMFRQAAQGWYFTPARISPY